MHITKPEQAMEHIEEAVIEDDSGEWLPDAQFHTLTMAEILERQGLKRDALRIYKTLLKKGGQNSLVIQERIDNLSGHSFRANEEMKKDFIRWVNKLQKGGN